MDISGREIDINIWKLVLPLHVVWHCDIQHLLLLPTSNVLYSGAGIFYKLMVYTVFIHESKCNLLTVTY